MPNHNEPLTRRALMKLCAGIGGAMVLPTFGCTTVAPAGAQSSGQPRIAGGPPWAPKQLEFASTGGQKTSLSQLTAMILVDKNPYYKSSADTLPYLVDGGRQLMQVDFRQNS